jgi:hypothetical protein
MDDSDHFLKLNIASTSTDRIKNRIYSAKESDWSIYHELELLLLDIDDLATDTKIIQLINDIGISKRIGVYRTAPNTCFSWHFDRGRTSSINMLIEGFDSMCVFGDQELSTIKNIVQAKYIDISKLQHEPDSYYLMNVTKYHTVYNFGNQYRYMLSLGIPDKSFREVREYLKRNDML